jgi:ribosomal protein S6--L-glutamate ligase
MRIAVMSSAQGWHWDELRRAAAGRCELSPMAIEELQSAVSNEGTHWQVGGEDIKTCDALLVRTMPVGSLEKIVFRLDALAQIEAAGIVVINPARAIEAAVDKYLALAKLQRAGVPIPRTFVCQTIDHAMAAFRELGGDAVVKPLFGSGGRGITRVTDEALALRAFQLLEQFDSIFYLQEFIEHEGFDLRLLVIGQQVLGIERRNSLDWRTNVSRGAEPRPCKVTDELAQLALRAAEAIGAPLAGVDILPARDGRVVVLEVNSMPGWRGLQQALAVDVAQRVIDLVEATVVNARRDRENGER